MFKKFSIGSLIIGKNVLNELLFEFDTMRDWVDNMYILNVILFLIFIFYFYCYRFMLNNNVVILNLDGECY